MKFVLILLFLTQSLYADFDSSANCLPQGSINLPISDLLNSIDPSLREPSCQTLANNRWRMQRNASNLPSYLMKRDGQGNYQANFYIEYKPQRGSILSGPEMHKRVSDCLDQVSPYLKGPDGETLQIKILTATERAALPEDQRPSKLNIGIGPIEVRDNQRYYGSRIKCSDIVHEVMHLFGLVDEYRETSPELMASNNCRVITPDVSLMNQQGMTFEEKIPKTTICSCDDTCQRILNSDDPAIKELYLKSPVDFIPNRQSYEAKHCTLEDKTIVTTPPPPASFVSSTETDFIFEIGEIDNLRSLSGKDFVFAKRRMVCRCPASDQECLQNKQVAQRNIRNQRSYRPNCPSGQELDTIWGGTPGYSHQVTPENTITLTTNASGKSILYPNQFKRIVAGSCAQKVPEYKECSSFAYTGSGRNRICRTPARCQNPEFFLGTAP